MKPTLIVIILFLIAVASINGQNTQHAASQTGKTTDVDMVRELDSYLSSLVTEDKFSGAVLVAKGGVPIFKKAYGLANKSRNALNDTETKFNIGSMNKMFTAVAVAQLAEQGKLSFEDTISKHLPNYPNRIVANKVTIHQLLTHTSGLGNYQNEKFFAQLDRV